MQKRKPKPICATCININSSHAGVCHFCLKDTSWRNSLIFPFTVCWTIVTKIYLCFFKMRSLDTPETLWNPLSFNSKWGFSLFKEAELHIRLESSYHGSKLPDPSICVWAVSQNQKGLPGVSAIKQQNTSVNLVLYMGTIKWNVCILTLVGSHEEGHAAHACCFWIVQWVHICERKK